jgi:hypothetical protein
VRGQIGAEPDRLGRLPAHGAQGDWSQARRPVPHGALAEAFGAEDDFVIEQAEDLLRPILNALNLKGPAREIAGRSALVDISIKRDLVVKAPK